MNINLIISANLLRVRIINRYSQADIAGVLGIRQPSYNRMEAGHTRVSAPQLFVLAQFYRISVDVFFQSNPALDKVPIRDAMAKNRLEDLRQLTTMLEKENEELENRLLAKYGAMDSLMAELLVLRLLRDSLDN